MIEITDQKNSAVLEWQKIHPKMLHVSFPQGSNRFPPNHDWTLKHVSQKQQPNTRLGKVTKKRPKTLQRAQISAWLKKVRILGQLTAKTKVNKAKQGRIK
jgi:hypothetical protein